MWENERKKTIIRNVLVLLVLLAVAAALLVAMFTVKKKIDAEDALAALLVAMFTVKKKIDAEDALLQEEHANQRQELNEARQENVEAIRQTYENHKQVLAQYIPGIVCWGDSQSQAGSGSVYPRNCLLG